MATRFYYAPIDSGWGDVGRSVGGGIERGVSNFVAERERQRRNERQDELDERDRERFEMEKELHELGLYEEGYRRGEVPTEEVDFRSTPRREIPPGARPQDFFGAETAYGNLIVDPRTGDLVDPRTPNPAAMQRSPTADMPEPGPVGMSLFSREAPSFEALPDEALKARRNLPGYEQVTSGLYRDPSADPEARARRETLTEQLAVQDEIAEALMQAYPELPEERARGLARLQGMGANVPGWMQDIVDPEAAAAASWGTPRRDEYGNVYQINDDGEVRFIEGVTERVPGDTGGGGVPGLSYGAAMDSVEEMYAIRNRLGDTEGYLLSPGEMHSIAVRMTQDPGYSPPPREQFERRFEDEPGISTDRGGAPEEDDGLGILGRIGRWWRESGPGSGGREGGVQVDSATVQEGRRLIEQYPNLRPDQVEGILEDVGFTDEEIEAILGRE